MQTRLMAVSILGASFILGCIVFGAFIYQSRVPDKNIKVVGAATQRLVSDIIKWRITLSRTTGLGDVKNGYSLLKSDLRSLKGLLKANGIGVKEITIQPVNTSSIYGQYERGGLIGYAIQQNVFVISRKVSDVEKMALNPNLLSDQGIILQSSNLEYYFSRLNDIKKTLLAAATADAKRRAEAIADSSGDRIGRIESARSGVFQITEPYSTDFMDYGVYNTMTKEKDITVTVHAIFTLN
ncbi:MAG: SIMPL domain-containing protein [Bacillota bacterium]